MPPDKDSAIDSYLNSLDKADTKPSFEEVQTLALDRIAIALERIAQRVWRQE